VIPSAALTHDAAPEFDYGWRAGVALAVPIFTTHRAGVQVEQSTLEHLGALRQALQSSRDVRLRSLDAASQFQDSLADLERAIGAPLP
jgi:hypothetical protein